MKNRVAYFGVFTALALIFSYIETLVPISFGIPGVKHGLANLIIVIALYKIPLREVYVLSIVRVLLSGVLFGNYFSIAYSLAVLMAVNFHNNLIRQADITFFILETAFCFTQS